MLELYRIRHGVTAQVLTHNGIRLAGVVALGLTVFIASDIVVSHQQNELKAEASMRECIAVLNGDTRMLDKETGEIAKVTWTKIDLVGGVK